jgi:hypothetical protein
MILHHQRFPSTQVLDYLGTLFRIQNNSTVTGIQTDVIPESS